MTEKFDPIAEGLKAMQEQTAEVTNAVVSDASAVDGATAAQADAAPPAAPSAPTDAAPVAAEAKLPPSIEKGLEKLAQERAAFRAEQERLKPYLETLKQFDPLTLTKVQRAAQQQDAGGLLSAFGLQPPAPAAPPTPESATQAEIQRMRSEMEALKAFQQEATRRQNYELVAKAAERTDFLRETKDYDTVFAYLQDYKNKTGGFPADNWEESVALAVEAVEAAKVREAETYYKVLTKKQGVVASAPAPQMRAEPQAVGATLTNSRTNGPPQTAVPAQPRTPEEYQAAALEEAKKHGWL